MINRDGQAKVPEGVEIHAGNAADPTFAREMCAGAAVVYNNALNPPDDKWPELFPGIAGGRPGRCGGGRGDTRDNGESLHVRADWWPPLAETSRMPRTPARAPSAPGCPRN